jgi:hypothetical protein
MKNKKIIFGAFVLIVGAMILITNAQAITISSSEQSSEWTKKSEIKSKYKLMGKGYIKEIELDGEDDVKGVMKGNLSVVNKKAPVLWGYNLLIFDMEEKKILTKWKLPSEFILKNFSGTGQIKFMYIPHSTSYWTEFYLIGSAEELVYV